MAQMVKTYLSRTEKVNRSKNLELDISSKFKSELNSLFLIKSNLQVVQEVYIGDTIALEILLSVHKYNYYFYMKDGKIFHKDLGLRLSKKDLKSIFRIHLDAIDSKIENEIYNLKGVREFILNEWKDAFRFKIIEDCLN